MENPNRAHSLIQIDLATPSRAESLDDLAANIPAFQAGYELMAQPFEWKFTRADLKKLLARLAAHQNQRRGQPA
jgi:hypothetical protein